MDDWMGHIGKEGKIWVPVWARWVSRVRYG